MAVDNPNRCGYCGRVFTYEVRHHSGVRECSSCWDWRKMSGPMARYWTEKIEALFAEGPDLWDYQTWQRMGIRDEVVEALNTLEAFRQRCEIAIDSDPRTDEGDAWRRAALGYSEVKRDDAAEA